METNETILVTGATGQQGRVVAKRLLQQGQKSVAKAPYFQKRSPKAYGPGFPTG